MWSEAQHVVVAILENILQGPFYMLLSGKGNCVQ